MDQEILNELYDALVRDYSKNPRNYGKIHHFCCTKDGFNKSCGDELTLYVDKDTDTIKDVKWEGDGCAIFRSSASLLSEKIIGLPTEKGKKLVDDFIAFIMENKELDEEYEPLHIFSGVKKFPARVKCALLPWRTMESLLQESKE